MKLEWIITQEDVNHFKEFYSEHKENSLVKRRFETNVLRQPKPDYSRERFWRAIVNCLLTTRQRSGPYSSITKFLNAKPFHLSLEICRNSNDLKSLVSSKLAGHGGIYRINKISEELSSNLNWLESKNGWSLVEEMSLSLINTRTIQNERKSSDFIRENLKGFGPKQSRNLLQMLGFTMYEIPIDSRVIEWMNEFKFPLVLSSSGLSDPNYYNFVMSGIQKLCEASEIYPCQIDAVIFSKDENWTDEALDW